MKHKKYIDIEGEIEAKFIYDKDISKKVKARMFRNGDVDRTELTRDLRIPAYFENMDDIYSELEKMKGQASQ